MFFTSDFELPGYIDLEFERTYQSSTSYEGPLGHGWTHNLDQLMRVEATRVVYRDDELREIAFELINVGQVVYNAQDALTLSRPNAAEYVLLTHDRQKLVFSPVVPDHGTLHLIRIEDLNYNAISLNYQDGLLHQIIDTVGRTLQFSYSPQRRLSAVELLSSELDGGRALLVGYRYDDDGDLIAVIDSLGKLFHFFYDDHLLVQFMNRNQQSCYFQYDSKRRCVRTWQDTHTMLREILFDDIRQVNIVYNSLGFGTLYRFNASGLITEEVDPLGNVSQTLFNENLDPLLTLDASGVPIEHLFEFDDRKNPLTETDAGGGITRYDHNQLNQLTRLEDAEGAVWEWEYDDRGNLLRTRSPRGAEWKYISDERGMVTTITQPNGRVLRATYSQDLRTQTLSDDYGIIVSHEYNLFGYMTSVTDGAGQTQLFSYDSAGHLLGIENPDGGVQRWRYDAEGNPIHYTSQNGTEMSLEYDGWALVTARVYPGDRRVRYIYDSEGELIEVINQNGEHHTFTADSLGRCVAQRFFDGRVETYEYNTRGDIVAIRDAAGQRMILSYDANSNLIQKHYPDGTECILAYDAVGRITSAQFTGTSIAYEYDGHSNVLKEWQNGRLLEYEYDIMDNRTRLQVDGSRERTSVYDSRDRLVALQDFGGTQHEFEYDVLDRMIVLRMPGGLQKRRSYGVWNRTSTEDLVAQDGSSIVRRRYEQDAEGKLVGIDDSLRGSTSYQYTAINQIQQVQVNGRVTEQYQYDPNGNLISAPDYPNIHYSPGNRLVEAENIRYDYDPNANISARHENGKTTYYRYDADGQLREVMLPSGAAIHYKYDALGRRVSKSHDEVETCFIWDDESLLEEAVDGQVSAEYLFEPETFFPLAQTMEGQLYLCNANELGTPTELLDPTGALVWSPTYRAFGTIINDRGKVESPFRFAGQYWDLDTGLHYNWFRYYVPEFGRYTSFDPMGLDAGLNSYQYTLNPINWIDPFGLSKKIASLPPYMEKARRRGVARMWAEERDLLRAGGRGSRNWTPTEKKIIMADRRPPGWEGHHKKSVKNKYAECRKIKNKCKKKQKELQAKCREEAERLAESASNLQPLRSGKSRAGRAGMKERNEHLAAHRGNFCNATHSRFNAGW
jgi:RHS repeat-associated protein